MRILHVIASVDLAGGGPIEGVLRSAEAWAADGHVCEIASLDAPDDPCVAACPVRVFALGIAGETFRTLRRRIKLLRYGYTPFFVPWLRRHARDYDAVIVNGLWNYVALGAARALPGGGTPYAVFTHGMLDPWFARTYPRKHAAKQMLWRFSEGRLLNRADAVLFTTEDERVLARESFRPYRVKERIVGYGTADVAGDPARQIAAFREATGLGEATSLGGAAGLGDRRFLLYLSRIHPKKGCDLLLRAFAAIAPAHPDLDLVIAGPDATGWSADLQALAASLGVAGRIHWPGMLTGDVKWGAFRACEAFVLPSHQENFGVVVAEALACGKPVLISDKVNIWREIVADGAGLVRPDDEAGATALLGDFLALPADERAAMGERARPCFLARFEIGRAADTLLDALRDMAAPPPKTPDAQPSGRAPLSSQAQ